MPRFPQQITILNRGGHIGKCSNNFTRDSELYIPGIRLKVGMLEAVCITKFLGGVTIGRLLTEIRHMHVEFQMKVAYFGKCTGNYSYGISNMQLHIDEVF